MYIYIYDMYIYIYICIEKMKTAHMVPSGNLFVRPSRDSLVEEERHESTKKAGGSLPSQSLTWFT